MEKLIAIAVVSKKKPKLAIKDIYSIKDIENVIILSSEEIIYIEISPTIAPKAPIMRYKQRKH